VASSGTRPTVVILLPSWEAGAVAAELAVGGFDPVARDDPRHLAAFVAGSDDVVAAVIDADSDPEGANVAWDILHRDGRQIPSLVVINGATFDRFDMSRPGHETDEYLTRPYSAESIRWRVEAMCIRSVAVDDGSGPVLQSAIDHGDWGRRGDMIAVFNPKGGVGKTMIATNLAATLAAAGKRVLLIDGDTVTGHVPTSLGMEGVPTVADGWRDELEGGPPQTFTELASAHPLGMRILPLSDSPIHTEILEPERIARSIAAARRNFDYVIADLHPSYSALNRAIFDKADRILVPITPDLPAIRAVMKLREVAEELGMRDRLALIVNRFNHGVAVADIERAVGMPCYAQIRSAGPVIVKATNEGRTLVEAAPKEAITADFEALADRILGREVAVAKPAFRLFGRAAGARA
jgi:MinD-like ATPase involved in chromosome partitioning or flagellar assembly